MLPNCRYHKTDSNNGDSNPRPIPEIGHNGLMETRPKSSLLQQTEENGPPSTVLASRGGKPIFCPVSSRPETRNPSPLARHRSLLAPRSAPIAPRPSPGTDRCQPGRPLIQLLEAMAFNYYQRTWCGSAAATTNYDEIEACAVVVSTLRKKRRWGGSVVGHKTKNRDRIGGNIQLNNDYFIERPLFNAEEFRRSCK
ncbi:hypothetical protein GQ55_1G404000 [Panicum hallii var. hallii]|uniref:Uncharacterized protein n=1 Tax=Panicum hallii var. hallii TaxID=1504633 RepID=A0A2T7FCL8_9POAL|nr:hypothetical protein GQ55_1G404000 [Panicum hallii var. hallii]